jgi:hypothetical protein
MCPNKNLGAVLAHTWKTKFIDCAAETRAASSGDDAMYATVPSCGTRRRRRRGE